MVSTSYYFQEILSICLKEQPHRKYYVIKNSLSLKFQNVMGIKDVLLQWFINFLKKFLGGAITRGQSENLAKRDKFAI